MNSPLETYRAMLRFSKHALDDALEVQADVLDRIGTQCAELRRTVAVAHEKMRRYEGAVMARHKASGDTAVVAQAAARGDAERTRLHGLELDAAQELAEWESLYEAWKSRGYSIKELVSLYNAQYFTASATGNIDRRERPPVARHDYSVDRSERNQEATSISRPRRRVD